MSYANVYPMAQAVAPFFWIVGAGILAGALAWAWRGRLLLAFAVIAVATTFLVAGTLTARHGVPTTAQSAWLVGAIALEALLIPFAGYKFGAGPERRFVLVILLIVALHFVPMYFTFGYIMLVLAAAGAINALIAWRRPDYPLRAVWAVDGATKVLAGVALWLTPGWQAVG